MKKGSESCKKKVNFLRGVLNLVNTWSILMFLANEDETL